MLEMNKTMRRAVLLCSLAVLSTVGCAGPRLGSRLFHRETAVAASDAPSYVTGQRPLPSEQAVQPATVGLPARGQYDAQTVSNIRRTPRNSYGGSTSRAACSS